MKTQVTTVCDLEKELPPDAPNAPQWLVKALQVPREEGFIESQGCDVHYFRWGNPENPPLILMHGFLAHARCMAFIAPFLAENYHVVAYDLTGMGDSGVRDAYPDSVRAQEVVDVAQKTGLFEHAQKPIVIAHSYGGHVGLTAMNEHHSLFGGLIICDLMVLRLERLKAHFAGGRPLRSDPNRPNRVYPDYAAAKSRFVLSPNQPCGEPYLFDYMAFHSLKEVEGGWTWKFDTSVFDSDFSVRDRILHQAEAVVAAPGRKAYIYGQESLLFDDDSADYVREMGGTDIPFIGVPGARHHLMLDEPIAFVSTLRSVLALWSASEESEASR